MFTGSGTSWCQLERIRAQPFLQQTTPSLHAHQHNPEPSRRLAERSGSFRYLPETLLTHRLHPGTATAGGIEAGQRQCEDRLMFRRFWPAPFDAMLAALYSLSLRTRA